MDFPIRNDSPFDKVMDISAYRVLAFHRDTPDGKVAYVTVSKSRVSELVNAWRKALNCRAREIVGSSGTTYLVEVLQGFPTDRPPSTHQIRALVVKYALQLRSRGWVCVNDVSEKDWRLYYSLMHPDDKRPLYLLYALYSRASGLFYIGFTTQTKSNLLKTLRMKHKAGETEMQTLLSADDRKFEDLEMIKCDDQLAISKLYDEWMNSKHESIAVLQGMSAVGNTSDSRKRARVESSSCNVEFYLFEGGDQRAVVTIDLNVSNLRTYMDRAKARAHHKHTNKNLISSIVKAVPETYAPTLLESLHGVSSATVTERLNFWKREHCSRGGCSATHNLPKVVGLFTASPPKIVFVARTIKETTDELVQRWKSSSRGFRRGTEKWQNTNHVIDLECEARVLEEFRVGEEESVVKAAQKKFMARLEEEGWLLANHMGKPEKDMIEIEVD